MTLKELQQQELELKGKAFDVRNTMDQYNQLLAQHGEIHNRIVNEISQIQVQIQQLQAAPIEAQASEPKEPEAAEAKEDMSVEAAEAKAV